MSKPKGKQPLRQGTTTTQKGTEKSNLSLWVLAVCALTAIVFFPMLSNGFTNWDDPLYITENMLLRGPDWHGIFTQPVVSNYHPLTVASLALNYQLSELKPGSYHVINWAFHIANTALVFFLAFRLSEGNQWVGFLTALFFGIHPMHVESVAWASERKDVLFCFFYLLALLSYLRYKAKPGWQTYTGALVLFAFSLLSKPAAVTLPVVLVLIDWYQGRSLRDKKIWLEKLPFFALALAFGVVNIQVQADMAIADPTYYTGSQRVVFALYGFGEYIKRLFLPTHLSAIHPFPKSGEIPLVYYVGVAVTLATLVALWFFRKNKHVVFGVAFFAINVALVLQFFPFGNSVISERYTYVPYIGLVFALAMLWAVGSKTVRVKKAVLGVFLTAGLVFSVLSNQQVRVWKNSLTLWSKAIAVYPDSYVALCNRGQYHFAEGKQMELAMADFTAAFKIEPDHANTLESRAALYLTLNNFEQAYADADRLIRLHPEMFRGYLFRAYAADRLNKHDQAIADYSQCITMQPEQEEPWANRGVVYFNAKQNYKAAKEDFDVAIRLNPNKGVNYLNRARCWKQFGNKMEAMKDLLTAKQLGTPMDGGLIRAVDAMQ